MTKERPGYMTLNTQLPSVLWQKLDEEASDRGKSVARLLAEILMKRYKVADDELPQPRRPGRPKRK